MHFGESQAATGTWNVCKLPNARLILVILGSMPSSGNSQENSGSSKPILEKGHVRSADGDGDGGCPQGSAQCLTFLMGA